MSHCLLNILSFVEPVLAQSVRIQSGIWVGQAYALGITIHFNLFPGISTLSRTSKASLALLFSQASLSASLWTSLLPVFSWFQFTLGPCGTPQLQIICDPQLSSLSSLTHSFNFKFLKRNSSPSSPHLAWWTSACSSWVGYPRISHVNGEKDPFHLQFGNWELWIEYSSWEVARGGSGGEDKQWLRTLVQIRICLSQSPK